MYGPGTEWVKALVERVRTLTMDEMGALAADWDAREAARAARAARAAAGEEAWAVAWAAGCTAAWAAWAAAWDVGAAAWAARAAAGEAAWAAWAAEAAARGLAIRHLIGVGGFTRAHYDALVAPWRAAIGPLHPDDDEEVG